MDESVNQITALLVKHSRRKGSRLYEHTKDHNQHELIHLARQCLLQVCAHV